MKTTTTFACLALVTASLSALPARAGLFDLDNKLTADDAGSNHRFGRSVAISGNTALVGAAGGEVIGSIYSSGSAYLFDITTGSQIAKLQASDAAGFDDFGKSVAISGNTALVGAEGDGDKGVNSGSAYLFNTTTGSQIAKLTASDAAAGDSFGRSVAISGNTALIAGGRGNGGNLSSYLFDITTGSQIAKLTADDASAARDNFGGSVAISGNTALIGAAGDDHAGYRSGSAYLFNITTGSQIAKLTADDAAEYDQFGGSVAISGNTALVAAAGDDRAGSNSGSGSAYLFDITTGSQIAKLTLSDPVEHERFGRSVAISGNTALVGSFLTHTEDSDSGSAYLFDITTGSQIAKLTASDVEPNHAFGWSVAISGNTALVGSQYDDDAGGFRSGSVYLFKTTIPEPTALVLCFTGITGIGFLTRRSP